MGWKTKDVINVPLKVLKNQNCLDQKVNCKNSNVSFALNVKIREALGRPCVKLDLY